MGKNKSKRRLGLKNNSSAERISKSELTGSKHTHIMFNFSFITSNKNFSFHNPRFIDKHKVKLLDRIHELSSSDFITVLSSPKEKGIEFIDQESFKRKVSYHPDFDKSEFLRRSAGDKYAVFRIYPNNNPIPSRVIGKIIHEIFYIMYIDLNHDMYDG